MAIITAPRLKELAPYLLLFSSVLGYSQTLVDSLRNQIDLTGDSEHKVDLLNDLAFELFDYSMEAALQSADEALSLSQRINYRKGEGWAQIHRGLYFMLAGNTVQSVNNYKEALQISRETEDPDLESYAILQTGKVVRDVGHFDSAAQYYKQAEAIQINLPKPDLYNLCRIYSALSRIMLLQENNAEAMAYAERGLAYANELQDKIWLGYAWLDLGDAYRNQYNFEKAYECYQTARDHYGSFSWVNIDSHESIGIAMMMQGNFNGAFESLNQVMIAYDLYKGRHALARTLIQMGLILEEQGVFDVASEYLNRALEISKAAGYLYLIGEANYGLAWVNYRGGHSVIAEKFILDGKRYFERTRSSLRVASFFNLMGLIQMKKGNYDSSLYYHQQALAIRKTSGKLSSISSSYFNLGELYLEMKDWSLALSYFRQGYEIDLTIGDQYGLSMNNDRLGRIYAIQHDFKKARIHLEKSIELSLQTSSYDILGAAYLDYANLNEQEGKLKEALHYRKLYEANNDSLYSRASAQRLVSYRMLYDIAEKDRAIEQLNQEKQIQANVIQKRNQVIILIASALVLLAVLLYVLYHYSRSQKRMNRDLSERNEEIQTQSEELQEANNELMKLNDEVNRQREEIKSQAEELLVSNEAIARINEGLEKIVEQRTTDLRRAYQELDTFFYRSSHDFRRPLTTLMGLCEVGKLSVQDKNAIDLFNKVNITATNLDKMLVKLQSISDVGSHQLVHKEVLLRQIIDNELDNKQEVIQSKQIQVKIDVDLKEAFVSYPVLIKIIIENLIENAIDFSTPVDPMLKIVAYHQNGSVIMEFKDNGEGIKDSIRPQIFEMFFRGSVRSAGNGLGLYIARKASEKASGSISFKNNPDGGATFTVEIPNNKVL